MSYYTFITPIVCTTITSTPMYVFNQVVSLHAGTETVIDTDFIENAVEVINNMEDNEEDDREMRAVSQDSWSSSSLTNHNNEKDSTLAISILVLVGLMLGVTLAVLARVVIQVYNSGVKKAMKDETMRKQEELLKLTKARQEERVENVYVSNSVLV